MGPAEAGSARPGPFSGLDGALVSVEVHRGMVSPDFYCNGVMIT